MDRVKTPQEIQNQIFRRMSAQKKAEVTFSFFRLGKYLDGLKNAKISRIKKLSQNRSGS